MKATRREFMSNSVLGAVGAGMALTAAPNVMAAAQTTRAYQPGKHVLLLDGLAAGVVASAEIFQGTAGQTGTTTLQKMSGGKSSEIVLQCGTGMQKTFYDWIRTATLKQALRKNGALLLCDFNDNEVARMEFSNAVITEIGFPALDGASKDSGRLTLKFTPETIHFINKPGGKCPVAVDPKTKSWLASNFKLQILPMDCTYVSKIEAITIRPGVGGGSLGITMAASRADTLNQWYSDSSIGKLGTATKRAGQLDYLGPDMKQPLFTLKFTNLAISGISLSLGSTAEDVERAQMSWDTVDFSYGV